MEPKKRAMQTGNGTSQQHGPNTELEKKKRNIPI